MKCWGTMFIIFVDGVIACGKTSLLRAIAEKEIPNWYIYEEPITKYRQYFQYNPLDIQYKSPCDSSIVQLLFSQIQHSRLTEIIKRHSHTDDVLICERNLGSTQCFNDAFLSEGLHSKFTHKFIHETIKAYEQTLIFDTCKLFFLDIPLEVTKARINERGRPEEIDTRIDLDKRQELLTNAYKSYIIDFRDRYGPESIKICNIYHDLEAVVKSLIDFYKDSVAKKKNVKSS